MDPSLMRQREAFKARAMKMPTVEKRKIIEEPPKSVKKMKPSRPKPTPCKCPTERSTTKNKE